MDFNSYIYSKAAATRILGTEVVNTVPDGQYPRIWCWLPKGQKAVSVPKSKFKEHFAEHRRQQGKALSPMLAPEDDSIWYVSKYKVTVHPDHLSCSCKDWKSQSAIGINRPTCKHCYSVLYQLGCNSLAEYLEKNSEARDSSEATNQQDREPHASSSLADCSSCKYAQKMPSLFTEKQRYFCTLAYVESTNAHECLGDRAPQFINKTTI